MNMKWQLKKRWKMMSISNSRLKSFIKDLTPEVKKIGEMQVKMQSKIHRLKVHNKETFGIATEIDLKSEELIFKILKKISPDIPILSEERAFIEKVDDWSPFKKMDYCWVVDPLDGTNNYVNGIDYFSISIGLVKKGRPILGMVYRPFTQELFSAVHGCGAYYESYRQKKIKIKREDNKKEISSAIVATGFGMKKSLSDKNDQKFFLSTLKSVRAVRRLGSAALDLCFLASGKLDVYWENGLAPWDMAAGVAICEEANIQIKAGDGKKFDCFTPSIIASQKTIFRKLSTMRKNL